MDAKVDDWVVTPRRGKAVEINALWYNALRLLDGVDHGASAARLHDLDLKRHADARARVVQPAVLVRRAAAICTTSSTARRATIRRAGRTRCSRSRSTIRCSIDRAGSRCMEVVRERLLTPVGLRSLAPGHPDYKAKYYGDLRSRDAAYHQGTVWALADRPVRRRLAEDSTRRIGRARGALLEGFASILSRRASGRSARSSTPRRRTRRAAAWRRRGASPKCCGASRRRAAASPEAGARGHRGRSDVPVGAARADIWPGVRGASRLLTDRQSRNRPRRLAVHTTTAVTSGNG